MQDSNIPVKFVIPWGNGAGAPYIRTIPVNSQIGINNGYASLTDGFVPLNMQPVASGGIPPFGQDMNGILKQITQSDQWMQAGGNFPFDASFQSSISGYPKGAIVPSVVYPGVSWLSLVDNNLSNPDTGGDNWITWGDGASNDIKFRPTAETLPGWIPLTAGTIGSATSGASVLAAAKTLGAYTWHWSNFSNSQCPVTGGRGSSALADFNANKSITVLDMRGYNIMGLDGGTNRLNGIPVTSGNRNTAGSLLGENQHALIVSELAVHNHSITDTTHSHTYVDPTHAHNIHGNHSTPAASGLGSVALVNPALGPSNSNLYGVTDNSAIGITINLAGTGITINNTGNGVSHNNVENSIIGTFYLKL